MSAAQLALALIFTASAVSKMRAPGEFLVIVEDTITSRLAQPVGAMIIAAEVAIASSIVFAPTLGSVIALGFTFCAAAVISYRFSKSATFSCGCWGGRSAPPSFESGKGLREWRSVIWFSLQDCAVAMLATKLLLESTQVGADAQFLWVVGSASVVPIQISAGLFVANRWRMPREKAASASLATSRSGRAIAS